MNLLRWLAQKSGLDIRSAEYSYGEDPVLGFTSNRKHADRWVNSTCGYCSVGCGMQLGVREGKVVSVRGNPDHPVNLGKLCPKGLAEHYAIDANGRAKYPLLRKNGQLARIGWDVAIDTLVERFRKIQQKYGPESLGIVSTGQLVTEEFYALGKLVQLGFGTTNYDGNTTLCMSTAVAGYKRSFGSDGPPGAYEDLEVADVILLIGANIAENHPILCTRLEANSAKTLIVADPRVTKTAMMADVYLPVKPRSDLALINAILRILIDEELYNKEYVELHTTGFAELRASLAPYTVDYAASITGLSPELIRKTALLYGNAKAAFIGWTMGVNHSTKGTETVNAINNLALITQNIGRPGASPFSITGQCNAMGTREAGFSSGLPGYRKFESSEDREELARLWNLPVDRIPTKRGLAYPDIIEAAVSRKIRALWIIGTNPLVSFPNIDVLKHGLGNLDFLVVQDGFHPTPTTELADMVLPAAIWGEKEGTYTNSERRVSKVNAAVKPPGEARRDFDIFLAVAERLGCGKELFPGWRNPSDAFEEWRRVSTGRLCDYSGITYAALETAGGLQWPCPVGASTNPAAPRRLYTDGRFQTDDGRARLVPTQWAPFPEQPHPEFPLILNTGRTVEHWHTRTKTGGISILQRLSPRAWLEMNPVDAGKLGLKPHEHVDVISARGRVSKVELRITEIVAPGQIFLPFHFVESNANQITQSAFDPISREPNFKQCAVRVEKSSTAHA
ncbi:MAG: molybdopterin-dependent oxidoreductase [Acidobacteriota bacterium]|nr:molybdopterin-dependent oxidoreductase [Acidobacteriota bacterium]